LETPADDHVPDGCTHEFLVEPPLAFLVREELARLGVLVRQFDPYVGLEHLVDVFELVIGTYLVDLLELSLQGLLLQGGLEQRGLAGSTVPGRQQRNILHFKIIRIILLQHITTLLVLLHTKVNKIIRNRLIIW
jgi:hypothetical protein